MKRTKETLSNKKVLIVLDDVADSEQVEKLVGRTTLYSGSRILITIRNKDVLRINGPNYQILEYEMEVMRSDHALELFRRHAFNRDSPSNDYRDLSREIVFATGRLPLALEVIGSFLFDKRQQIWKETMEKLRKAPNEDVFGKLKISYDALNYEQQQIFLDIACFFIGGDKVHAIYMWKECDFFPEIGVDVLICMSLVKIEENTFWMHDQLRDLGREIVRRESPMNPGERSRIWIKKEALDAIRTKEMKKNVQALILDLHNSDLKTIRSEEIERFERLRYLQLNRGTFNGNLANSLTNLSWIVWSSPPPVLKPTNMRLKNLVVLEFSDISFIDDSKLQSLIKMAGKLKVLSIERCRSINRAPDFSGCPNLEKLHFENCPKLRKLDSSIGNLKSLIDLKISNCSLEDLPEEIGNLVKLTHFSIKQCKVKKLPDSIWKLKSLRELHFKGGYYANSWELPSSIMLQNLTVLRLHCPNLKGRLPSAIGSLPFLRILHMSKTCISEVPETVGMLPCLQTLELKDCDEIQELPTLPTSLNILQVSSKSLRVAPNLSNLTNLVLLDLSDGSSWRGGKICTGDLRGIGRLSKLNKLNLELLNVPAPSELASLSQLKELHLSGLVLRTAQFPSSLLQLRLDKFDSTVSLSSKLENLSSLELSSSQMQEVQVNGLQLQNLTRLRLNHSTSLERFGLSNMRKLEVVSVYYCSKLVEIQFSGVFESLKQFSIEYCESLRRLAYAGEVESANELIIRDGRLILLSRVLNKLTSFCIRGCPKILQIEVLGISELLVEFEVGSCESLHSVRGISHLKKLKHFYIEKCHGLLDVKGLDELEFLNRLNMDDCPSLERLIDVSTTKLPGNCRMEITGRWKLAGAKKNLNCTVQTYKKYEGPFAHCCRCFWYLREEDPVLLLFFCCTFLCCSPCQLCLCCCHGIM